MAILSIQSFTYDPTINSRISSVPTVVLNYSFYVAGLRKPPVLIWYGCFANGLLLVLRCLVACSPLPNIHHNKG